MESSSFSSISCLKREEREDEFKFLDNKLTTNWSFYTVAQVIQHSSEEDNVYITDEISGEYGYIVSHREFNRDKYEGNQDSTVTLRMNLTCVSKPALLTLAVLSWDIRGCDRDFLEINYVKLCNNNATIGTMHEASPVQHNSLLELRLTFHSDGERGQAGFLIRYRGKYKMNMESRYTFLLNTMFYIILWVGKVDHQIYQKGRVVISCRRLVSFSLCLRCTHAEKVPGSGFYWRKLATESLCVVLKSIPRLLRISSHSVLHR